VKSQKSITKNNNKRGVSRRATQNKTPKKTNRKNQSQKSVAVTAVSRAYRNNGPQTSYMSNGHAVIRHREYFSDVRASAEFEVNKLWLNPGNEDLFPWLSQIALRYESFKFKRIRFDYEPACATTQTGTVMLVVDYDSKDDPPATKVDAMAYEESVRCAPWTSVSHTCKHHNLSKRSSYFTAPYEPIQDKDLSLVGNLFVCTFGNINTEAGDLIGELYVDYDVELSTPQREELNSGFSVSNKDVIQPFATSTVQGVDPPILLGSNFPVIFINSTKFTIRKRFAGYITIFANLNYTNGAYPAVTVVTSHSAFLTIGKVLEADDGDGRTKLAVEYYVDALLEPETTISVSFTHPVNGELQNFRLVVNEAFRGKPKALRFISEA
jgi:hypothetical protein